MSLATVFMQNKRPQVPIAGSNGQTNGQGDSYLLLNLCLRGFNKYVYSHLP